MSLMSDIVQALEGVDLWKRLKSAPGEIEALKERIDDLEERIEELAGRERCEYCRKRTLELQSMGPHPTFGDMGARLAKYVCSACGKADERILD